MGLCLVCLGRGDGNGRLEKLLNVNNMSFLLFSPAIYISGSHNSMSPNAICNSVGIWIYAESNSSDT